MFLAGEEEIQSVKVNLEPLKKDLKGLLAMLDEMEAFAEYAIDEVKLTAFPSIIPENGIVSLKGLV